MKRGLQKFSVDANVSSGPLDKGYVQILEILNDKSIVKRISSLFGLSKNSYCSQIILLLGSQNPISDNLKEAFLSSIPKFYAKSSAV